jgi:hypothetical protein
MSRLRLVEVGMAAALAAATVTAVGLVQSAGASSSGTASSYVPIVPCRLVDTRPGGDNVGTRTAPLGPGEAATFAVWGTNGNCTIPTSATGIATNVTAVNPTASSYITIYPSDADPRPAASNLNVIAGGAPTPNQVTVGLSGAGAISAYNNGGTVDLLIDIVGYYQPASAGTGTQGPKGDKGDPGTNGKDGAPGPACPTGGCTIHYLGNAATGTGLSGPGLFTYGCASTTGSSVYASLAIPLPDGATITKVTANYMDDDPTYGLTFWVYQVIDGHNQNTAGGLAGTSPTTTTSTTLHNLDVPLGTSLPTGPAASYYLLVKFDGGNSSTLRFCGAAINYHF